MAERIAHTWEAALVNSQKANSQLPKANYDYDTQRLRGTEERFKDFSVFSVPRCVVIN